MIGTIDSGSGGGTVPDSGGFESSSDSGGSFLNGISNTVSDTATDAASDFASDPVGTVDDATTIDEQLKAAASSLGSDSSSSGSSDSSGSDSGDGFSGATSGGVDVGLTRATGDGGGGDVAMNDPVGPSASPDTTDREAMVAEANEQQETIDQARADQAAPGAPEGTGGPMAGEAWDPMMLLAVVAVLAGIAFSRGAI